MSIQLKSYQAVLFDMDGTLFLTESLHELATKNLLSHYQLEHLLPSWDEFTGENDYKIYRKLKLHELTPLTQEEFIKIKMQLIEEHVQNLSKHERQKLWVPGMLTILQEVKAKKIPRAVVTSSPREMAQFFLNLLNVREDFDTVVALEDVATPKPSPAPYLMAMRFFQVKPQEVLIFEDSPVGLEAAHASGAKVIAINDSLNSLATLAAD